MTCPIAPARMTAPTSRGGMEEAPAFIHPLIAGSIDRCEIATTNCPGPAAGTGSLVTPQSEALGSPDGRAASRTWRLIEVTVRLPAGTPGVPSEGNPAESVRQLPHATRHISGAAGPEYRVRRGCSALLLRGSDLLGRGGGQPCG